MSREADRVLARTVQRDQRDMPARLRVVPCLAKPSLEHHAKPDQTGERRRAERLFPCGCHSDLYRGATARPMPRGLGAKDRYARMQACAKSPERAHQRRPLAFL